MWHILQNSNCSMSVTYEQITVSVHSQCCFVMDLLCGGAFGVMTSKLGGPQYFANCVRDRNMQTLSVIRTTCIGCGNHKGQSLYDDNLIFNE